MQGAGDPEPAGSFGGGDAAGQGDLVGDTAADLARVGQDRALLGEDLGAGESDHQGGLDGRGCGLDAFEQRDLVDPRHVVRGAAHLRSGCGGGCGVRQLAQPSEQGGQLLGHDVAGNVPGGSVGSGRGHDQNVAPTTDKTGRLSRSPTV